MSSLISCIIVDDEPLAVALLESYARKCHGIQLLNSFTNPFAALQFLEKRNVDFLLLDIQMPELTGIQFMKIINKKCDIVLTTAYPEYAVNAFDLDVVDYLLKPITYERFKQAVNKVREKRYSRSYSENVNPLPDYILVKSDYRQVKVSLKDIRYLEGLRDYVAVHTNQHKLLTLQSMKRFEETLPANFIRVHKSFIINSDAITSFKNNMLFLDKTVIPIGAVYAQNLKNIFLKFEN